MIFNKFPFLRPEPEKIDPYPPLPKELQSRKSELIGLSTVLADMTHEGAETNIRRVCNTETADIIAKLFEAKDTEAISQVNAWTKKILGCLVVEKEGNILFDWSSSTLLNPNPDASISGDEKY